MRPKLFIYLWSRQELYPGLELWRSSGLDFETRTPLQDLKIIKLGRGVSDFIKAL